MKLTFRTSMFIAFILFGFIIVLFTQFVFFKFHEAGIKKESVTRASEIFLDRDTFFNSYISSVNAKLSTILHSDTFQNHVLTSSVSQEMKQLFLDIAGTNENIMQLRYIDAQGMEKIRVDRDNFASTPYLIADNKLQNKNNRYYFHEIMNLDSETFWYSKIDLNIEHGEIEQPYKPVLRAGIPVFKNHQKIGLLIINIFMEDFLAQVSRSAYFNIYIVDKNGYYLVDQVHGCCWSQYVEEPNTLKNHFEDYAEILEEDWYEGDTLYASRLSFENGEELRMILVPKESAIEQAIQNDLNTLLWIMGGAILLSFPLSFLFARTPTKLKEEVDKLNDQLELKVQAKTKELRNLNEQLELKVIERTREQNVLLSLFDKSDAVLFKWRNDENWSVEYVSQSVERLFGYTQQMFQSGELQYAECVHKNDLERVVQEVLQAQENSENSFTHEPYRIVAKNGSVKWLHDHTVIVRDDNGNVQSFVGYLTDITQLKDSEMKLIEISRTDQLTQIHNRMYLDETLATQQYRFIRNNEACSVILIDIDYFKAVNDEHGHLIGDSVLIQFAKLINSSIREGDIFGRWGGEEFLIILPHTKLEDATSLAIKLRQKVEQFEFSVVQHKTASFGVSTFEKNQSVEEVVARADMALYQSKENGRNRVTTL